MSARVSVQDVRKAYRRGGERVAVLDKISLDIESNEFVAITGPSGSGKTTLLNLIGGLDNPDSGVIEVGDDRVDTMRGSARSAWRAHNIGFIFQFYNLIPVLSAALNVELPLLLTNLGKSERKHRVDAALSLVGLSERAAHRPSELSGGQQQRVAIARALVADPKVLVCDEPTGDLDRQNADNILELLATLARNRRSTVLMVTHDARAAGYADREIHLDKGVIEVPRRINLGQATLTDVSTFAGERHQAAEAND